MSGPKSTRYTLTPEQRRILAEARERERKTRREMDKLQQNKNEIATLKSNLETAIKNVDMLVERIGTGKEEQTNIRTSLAEIQEVIQQAYQKLNCQESCMMRKGDAGHQFYPDIVWPIVRREVM